MAGDDRLDGALSDLGPDIHGLIVMVMHQLTLPQAVVLVAVVLAVMFLWDRVVIGGVVAMSGDERPQEAGRRQGATRAMTPKLFIPFRVVARSPHIYRMRYLVVNALAQAVRMLGSSISGARKPPFSWKRVLREPSAKLPCWSLEAYCSF
jgi:hypothetical protein